MRTGCGPGEDFLANAGVMLRFLRFLTMPIVVVAAWMNSADLALAALAVADVAYPLLDFALLRY